MSQNLYLFSEIRTSCSIANQEQRPANLMAKSTNTPSFYQAKPRKGQGSNLGQFEFELDSNNFGFVLIIQSTFILWSIWICELVLFFVDSWALLAMITKCLFHPFEQCNSLITTLHSVFQVLPT